VVVYGSRPDGHARVVIETLLADVIGFEVVGLVDDIEENSRRRIGGLSVVATGSQLGTLRPQGIEGVVLGFGAANGRSRAIEAVEAARLALPTLVHPSAHVSASAALGDGVQILPLAYVGPAARIGRGALLNTAAIVEHDVAVGESAVVGPGAVLAGRSWVGSGCVIGARAVVLPDVRVEACAVVGAGAVVTTEVGAGRTVIGVPAREVQASDRTR
jgi:UDP-perosamine 4-acetyltransferase